MLLEGKMDKNILNELRQAFLDRGGMTSLPGSAQLDLRVQATFGTNAIEGNALTLEEVRTVVEGQSVGGRPMRDVLEAVQHEQAFRAMLAHPFPQVELVTILRFHEQVFRGILADAGQWRRVNVKIAGGGHIPPRMEKVLPMMDLLEKDYARSDLAGEEAFHLGAELHQRFEMIHPFSDGNGRVGRLLLDLHFLRHNWPPVMIMPSDRKAYLTALEKGADGDTALLEGLLRKKMATSLLFLLDKVGTQEDELVPLDRLGSPTEYSAKYLSLRCQQGALPGLLQKGVWTTSPRALSLYRSHLGRI
jgi:Fic family protein